MDETIQYPYAVFLESTGECLRAGTSLQEDITQQAFNPGEVSLVVTLEQADPELVYMLGGVAVDRPLLTSMATWDTTTITANGTSSATLGPTLPSGTVIRFTGAPAALGEIDDLTETSGSFIMNTTIAGDYTVTATLFPYQTLTTIITAT